MVRVTPRLLLLPVLAVSLAGCGGGGDDAKKAYVADASAICVNADSAFSRLKTPSAAADFAPFVRDTIAIAEKAQGDLSALTPPAGDKADLEKKVLQPFAKLVQDGKAFGDQVEAAGTDQAKLLPLVSKRPTAAGIDLDYLRSYGLGTCADAIDKAG